MVGKGQDGIVLHILLVDLVVIIHLEAVGWVDPWEEQVVQPVQIQEEAAVEWAEVHLWQVAMEAVQVNMWNSMSLLLPLLPILLVAVEQVELGEM
jgi:hypothetical protein